MYFFVINLNIMESCTSQTSKLRVVIVEIMFRSAQPVSLTWREQIHYIFIYFWLLSVDCKYIFMCWSKL